jgi:hypothetical protein
VVLSFDTTLSLPGITESPLTSSAQNAIIAAVAQTMGVDAANVLIVSQSVVSNSVRARYLTAGQFQIAVVTRTTVTTTTTSSSSSDTSPAVELFATLKARLTDAVTSSAFKATLAETSVTCGSTSTSNVGDVTVSVADYSVTDSPDGTNHQTNAHLSGGDIAGIVIACVLIGALLVVGVYLRVVRIGSNKIADAYVLEEGERQLENGDIMLQVKQKASPQW